MLSDPIRFEVKHVNGPGSPGEILIEGKKVNIRRLYTPPSVLQFGDQLGLDASGQPVVVRQANPSTGTAFLGSNIAPGQSRINGMTQSEINQVMPIMDSSLAFKPILPNTRFTFQFSDQAKIPLKQLEAEAKKSAAATEQQLRDDVRMLEDHNVSVRIANDQVASVLNGATGQALPPDRGSWTNWWVNKIGYASSSDEWTSRASVVQNVSIGYQPPLMPEGAARDVLAYGRRSCFGAGTLVQTIAGPGRSKPSRLATGC